jgi:hypothetical protein
MAVGATTINQLRALADNVQVHLDLVASIHDKASIKRLKHKKNFSAILLLTPNANTIDGHWVAVKRINGINFYFDSFGQPAPTALLSIIPATYIYNNDQIQPINANHCGEFSMAFLKHVYDRDSFDEFIEDFHSITAFEHENSLRRNRRFFD